MLSCYYFPLVKISQINGNAFQAGINTRYVMVAFIKDFRILVYPIKGRISISELLFDYFWKERLEKHSF